MHRAYHVSLSLLLLVLTGCAPALVMDDISHLRKGMSQEDLIADVQRKPKQQFTVAVDTLEYSILQYMLRTGTEKQYSTVPAGTGFIIVGIDSPYEECYYFAFYHDCLCYWGFIPEFSRESDPAIANLGRQIFAYTEPEKMNHDD